MIDTQTAASAIGSPAYHRRKKLLEAYFDRTASETWARLTSDAPVSRIRERVRGGRDRMRAQILDWLGDDLRGKRILDAGCGTGALAVEAARRGAEVLAIDIAGSLVEVAAQRTPEALKDRIDYRTGDMLDPSLGTFDHVVAMDSLIHYRPEDMADVVARLARNTRGSVVFTFAPNTPALTLLYGLGKLFPRTDRSPAIVPVGQARLRRTLAAALRGSRHTPARTQRVSASFYISQAQELNRN